MACGGGGHGGRGTPPWTTAIPPVDLDAVSRTYDLGFTPAFAAIVAGELWVTEVDGGRVVFLDKTTGDVLGEVATGAGAHAIAVSPDGARVWISTHPRGCGAERARVQIRALIKGAWLAAAPPAGARA